MGLVVVAGSGDRDGPVRGNGEGNGEAQERDVARHEIACEQREGCKSDLGLRRGHHQVAFRIANRDPGNVERGTVGRPFYLGMADIDVVAIAKLGFQRLRDAFRDGVEGKRSARHSPPRQADEQGREHERDHHHPHDTVRDMAAIPPSFPGTLSFSARYAPARGGSQRRAGWNFRCRFGQGSIGLDGRSRSCATKAATPKA